jgi:predicted esterase
LPALALLAAGCPYVPPETNFPHVNRTEAATGREFYVYLPSDYKDSRRWPLVITLHGTNPWDGRTRQILEWRDTAETHGLIVIAPQLRSSQGPMPTVPSAGFADRDLLDRDEEAILAILKQACRDYAVDPNCILLTGFSSGGYSMMHMALRHPRMWQMVIARDCNFAMGTLKDMPITDEVRTRPLYIFWGKDDAVIRDQSWEAYRYLRENRCFQVDKKVLPGGHLRRPDLAYEIWAKRLPKEYRR